MDYRREIDGLRGLAVVPVIFFHADIEYFSGGFVGVDVFFVISGYLITTITLNDLERGEFTLAGFYERRARRILPTLFAVMIASSVTGFFLLMPDEFKNLGQSLVATSFFSNNILLALTSGYWNLASEFKPLLHTWSLGVEERYHVFTSIALIIIYKLDKRIIPYLLLCILISSFSFAVWLTSITPDRAFYFLPTRAWELAMGGITAVFIPHLRPNNSFNNLLSFLGLAAIITSVFVFDDKTLSPSYPIIIPTIGTVLTIIFCRPNTLSYYILSHSVVVFTGLISYSLYLWHQPIFAFLRVCSTDRPHSGEYMALVPIIFLISYLSWKYIESPFRRNKILTRNQIFISSISGILFFTAIGLYLDKNYGIPSRIFDPEVNMHDMDKRIYNKQAYEFKTDEFLKSSKIKILIIGNSFARDFTNITVETFDTHNCEIVYRPDLNQCIFPYSSVLSEKLYSKADVIVFANGSFNENCLQIDLQYATKHKKKIFYVGTKNFGYNLNWLIRLNEEERFNLYNSVSYSVINSDMKMENRIPRENYISLLKPTLIENTIPITDHLGRLLSTDRTHLTRYGAIFFGKKAVLKTPYSKIFE